MPSIPGSNFVVHGTKPNGGALDYGPFDNFNTAENVANDAVTAGEIVDWYITYTDTHGNEIRYDQA